MLCADCVELPASALARLFSTLWIAFARASSFWLYAEL